MEEVTFIAKNYYEMYKLRNNYTEIKKGECFKIDEHLTGNNERFIYLRIINPSDGCRHSFYIGKRQVYKFFEVVKDEDVEMVVNGMLYGML